jgi:hypothetical protein
MEKEAQIHKYLTGKDEHSSVSAQEFASIRFENMSIHVLRTGIHKYLTGKHEHPGVSDKNTQVSDRKHERPGVADRSTQVHVFRCC